MILICAKPQRFFIQPSSKVKFNLKFDLKLVFITKINVEMINLHFLDKEASILSYLYGF